MISPRRPLALVLGGVLLLGFGPMKGRAEEQAAAALSLAQSQVERGDVTGAVNALKQIGRDYPETRAAAPAAALLAQLLLAQGDAEAALKQAQAALAMEAEPSVHRDARYVAGMAWFELGRLPEAREQLAPLDGQITDPLRLTHLAEVMVQVEEATGRPAERLHWLSVLSELRSGADEALAREIQATIDAMGQGDLAASAARFGARPPGDLVAVALIRAQLRAREFNVAARACDDFMAAWPGHALTPSVQILKERALSGDVTRPTRVGVLLPLSGKYAPQGEQARNGMTLAVRSFPTPSWAPGGIELVFRDTKGEEAAAGQAVRELVLQEHVVAVVGPLTSAEVDQAARTAEAFEVPLIALTQKPGVPEIGPWVFRAFPTLEDQMSQLAEQVVVRQGLTRVAILYPEQRYGALAAERFWLEVEERGGVVSAVESYPTGEGADLNAVAQRLGIQAWPSLRAADAREIQRRRLNDDDPDNDKKPIDLPPLIDFDAVFIADQYKQAVLMASALAFDNFPLGTYTAGHKGAPLKLVGMNTWVHKDLPRIGGEYFVNSIFLSSFFVDSTDPETTTFVRAYKDRYGAEPDLFAASAYDAVGMLIGALQGEQPSGREQVRARLATTSGFEGATGTINASPVGELTPELTPLTINRKRQMVPIAPPPPQVAPEGGAPPAASP